MNVDKRRNNGPEESYSPLYDVDEKWLEEQKKKRSSKGKARDDGRQADELRPICEHLCKFACKRSMLTTISRL